MVPALTRRRSTGCLKSFDPSSGPQSAPISGLHDWVRFRPRAIQTATRPNNYQLLRKRPLMTWRAYPNGAGDVMLRDTSSVKGDIVDRLPTQA